MHVKYCVCYACLRERERFGNKSVDVGMRIIRFESFEEGPITPLHAREIVREREKRERERDLETRLYM